ncbi:hypothetical protein CfE428DRAFT_1363 [Chthoniobacter flavus Ellin428]|uniref:Uncharacterized protein n=1 Tax=Chthoniobacter flavus Ellin428 TaxID=497964 RepID=B4CXS2_9BACT|nr:hypothetical protein [Chthoniobacter flavus]EDY21070.1 hypothetical protein CfE428DRAFT_1363 [Chthoniobacter flavus Ellin428]TCO88792.1 hypothetical protein EV701_116164 [Chthoniobacter flavus]
MTELPFVRRGQPITAELWNKLVAAVRSVRLLPGDGARLRSTPDGTLVGFDAAPSPWPHAFQVTLFGQTAAQISSGLVNGIEPKIGDVPMSGTDKQPPPRLEFGKLKLDPNNRGYVAIEITCDDKWKITTMEMVQVAYFDSENGEDPPTRSGGVSAIGGIPGISGRRVRYPVAMLVQRKSGQLDVVQIVFFNLAHRAQPRDNQSDAARHFFWPGAA